MFFNVCENAIKYNHPGGEVVFTISKMGETVIVEDTGIIRDIDRIFERFYRVDKSHSNQKGSGLWIIHCLGKHNSIVEMEAKASRKRQRSRLYFHGKIPDCCSVM